MPLVRSSARFLATAVAVAASVWTLGARQPQPAAAAADVPTVRIDAIVTDANGRAILDLRASDFEFLESGAPKGLATVELRTLPRVAAEPTPIETEADEERAARQPGTRVFAFFLDEFHVSPGASTARVRAALNAFIDENLKPQDLAIVMKPLDAVTSIRFTRDRDVLHGAVEGFSGRKGDYAPRTRFEELYIGRAPAAVIAAHRQIVTAGLREMTMRLGQLEADRAAIVFVSEGFAREAASGRQGRLPDLQGLVRAASRFHLALYTVNPAMPEDDASPEVERERANAMLQWLAAQTGGRAIEAQALIAGLARLKHDLEAYYVLTYQPAVADGRFHPVEIRTKRRGVQVHTRPGYWAPLGSEWRTLVAGAVRTASPLSTRPLRRSRVLDAWVGLLRDAGGQTRMIITWEPRVRGIAAPEVVAITAKTAGGTLLFEGRIGHVGSESALPPDSARFQVPTGRIELDMAIFDGEGKVIDTDARDFDVPDLGSQKRGPVLLAPEVVRARTLRDFRSATANPDAAPSPVRTFVRGDRLLIRVPAFDASGTAVQVTAKVLNAWGQPMRDIDAIGMTPRDGLAQFALPLSWLVPGQYEIELLGTNANGEVKERVSFRISG